MTAQVAARRFVIGVLHRTLNDLLDLDEREAAAYGDVEAAVRQTYKVLDYDLPALEKAVREAAPDSQRAAVAIALSKLTEAYAEDVTAKQQTAFIIGVEVGRALRPTAVEGIGQAANRRPTS